MFLLFVFFFFYYHIVRYPLAAPSDVALAMFSETHQPCTLITMVYKRSLEASFLSFPCDMHAPMHSD
jgi:hypothetical protein